MKKFLSLILLLWMFPAWSQLPMKTEEALRDYPTYRTTVKIPVDSVYKMTLENPGLLPEDFDKFKYMQKLCLFGNDYDYDFYQLPGYFFSFENLTHLTIANTDLTTLNKNIAKFENLQSLSLANNNLVALPAELADIEDLRSLVIDNNIKKIPPSRSLTHLEIIFETNVGQDSGTIPQGIPELRKLKSLTLNSELTLINIPQMISIIKGLPALEELTFIDPNLDEEDLKALSGIKKITRLHLPAILVDPEVMKGFSHLKEFSFGKYLNTEAVSRTKFWTTILAFPDLEQVSTTFEFQDTNFYHQLKKLNLTLNLDRGLQEQFAAIKNLPSLNMLTLPRSSTVPRNMGELSTVKVVDLTDLYGIDFSIVFGYLMLVPSLEKIIVSNDQFTVFPPETVKFKHLKEMEVINIEHGMFQAITEKEKNRAKKLLPDCKFTFVEMF